ncbi:PBECR2 nuclease fold domain-containing protein [Treponema phagedenis]|uniref:LPD3 domain-containing protein n=2 Tax=Treponema phagedenis TaxID=162 RepID=UPI0004652B8E|nr:PBECR2 nuclease fold domain-containing protein [Treponema phagedenis]
MRIVIDADVSKQIIHTLKSLSEQQCFHEVLKLMQKTFVESKHPRDEEGRFASKGGYVRAKRLKLKEKLKDYVGKDIKNEKTGIPAYISNESINKISSEKAIEKTKANGFTVDDHFYAASNIVPLFKKADLRGVYKDKNNSKDIVSIKRFNCRFRLPSGVAANAYITVKEARISGHKIYSLEVMELEKALKNEGLGMAVRKSNATCIPENTPPRTFSIPDSQKKARERETHQTDEQQQFHEILERMQKTFNEAEHPRDEAGRFTDKGPVSKEVHKTRQRLRAVFTDKAVPMPDIPFTRENYNKLFPRNRIDTPLGSVKLGEHQFEKLQALGRNYLLGAVATTLKNPVAIIREERDGRKSNLYVKSFIKDKKNKIVQSVVIDIDGQHISISTHEKDVSNVLNKIETVGQLIYIDSQPDRMAEQHHLSDESVVNPTRKQEKALKSCTTSIPHSQKKARAQNAALPKDFVSRCNMVSIQLMLLKWDIAAIQEEIDRRNNMYDLLLKSFNGIVQELKKTQGSKQRRL